MMAGKNYDGDTFQKNTQEGQSKMTLQADMAGASIGLCKMLQGLAAADCWPV